MEGVPIMKKSFQNLATTKFDCKFFESAELEGTKNILKSYQWKYWAWLQEQAFSYDFSRISLRISNRRTKLAQINLQNNGTYNFRVLFTFAINQSTKSSTIADKVALAVKLRMIERLFLLRSEVETGSETKILPKDTE